MTIHLNAGLRAAAAALSLLALAAPAAAEQPLSIFARAIGEGSARGEPTGQQFQRMRETTRSNAPFVMTAKVVKRFSQEGCARLAIELSQADVPTKSGRLTTFQTGWEMNTCVDGTPPIEGRDPKAMANLKAQLEAQRK
jgi:hypothetical protein